MAESMPKKTILVAVIGLLVLAGLGLAANFLIHRKTSDVHRGLTAPFITSSTSGKTTTRAKPPGKKGLKTRKHRNASLGPNWPFYGRSLDRTRNAADETAVRPPFRGVWSSRGGGSLEYPPTYANGVVYEAADSGYVAAYDLLSGKKLWFRKFHLTVLGSPALAERLLYLPCYDGRLYALDRRSGKTVWSHYIGGMLEGSPAVWRGKGLRGLSLGQHARFRCFQRSAAVEFRQRRSRQARACDRRQQVVLRRLRGLRLLPESQDRSTDLASAHLRPGERLSLGLLLLDAGCGLRTRLHR